MIYCSGKEKKIMAEYKFIEYMCRWCGMKTTRSATSGKPRPARCPRKKGDQPHTWVINRKY